MSIDQSTVLKGEERDRGATRGEGGGGGGRRGAGLRELWSRGVRGDIVCFVFTFWGIVNAYAYRVLNTSARERILGIVRAREFWK